ncbi:MAG TPA: DUF4956 domain-containing protein [Clostridiales bacterium]|nr:DUF4956 domain-containing protein [Clostridiales bacterium]
MSFADLFKKSILEKLPQEVSPEILVLTLLAATVLGMGIFLIYRRCFIGVVYDHSFNISLVVMTVLVAVIIVTISSNITLSLGMVGALSIVRYRTAVKSPLDLMFMFWAITTGIAVGANYFYIACGSFVFVALIFFLLKKWKGDTTTYMLVLNYPTQLETEEEVRRVLKTCKGKVRSKVVKKGRTELTAEVSLRNDNLNLTTRMSAIAGVEDVTLVQYRGSYEG